MGFIRFLPGMQVQITDPYGKLDPVVYEVESEFNSDFDRSDNYSLVHLSWTSKEDNKNHDLWVDVNRVVSRTAYDFNYRNSQTTDGRMCDGSCKVCKIKCDGLWRYGWTIPTFPNIGCCEVCNKLCHTCSVLNDKKEIAGPAKGNFQSCEKYTNKDNNLQKSPFLEDTFDLHEENTRLRQQLLDKAPINWKHELESAKVRYFQEVEGYLQNLEETNNNLLKDIETMRITRSDDQARHADLTLRLADTSKELESSRAAFNKLAVELEKTKSELELQNHPEVVKIWSKSTGLGPYTVLRTVIEEVGPPESPARVEAYICRNRLGLDSVIPISDATTVPKRFEFIIYFLYSILYLLTFKRLKY